MKIATEVLFKVLVKGSSTKSEAAFPAMTILWESSYALENTSLPGFLIYANHSGTAVCCTLLSWQQTK